MELNSNSSKVIKKNSILHDFVSGGASYDSLRQGLKFTVHSQRNNSRASFYMVQIVIVSLSHIQQAYKMMNTSYICRPIGLGLL